jgi:hypothetical protein
LPLSPEGDERVLKRGGEKLLGPFRLLPFPPQEAQGIAKILGNDGGLAGWLPKMAAPLDRVKALLAALPRQDQEDLTRFLHDILVTPEEAEARHVASLQAEVGGKPVTYTFRQEWVKCGKARCRCREGRLHGPYTYKYWREDGRLRKAYVKRA